MEKEPRKRTNKFQNLFSKAVLISFAVITLANIILFANGITIFLLNENQLLYLFSSMAQVIGGIFGLTLTAYVSSLINLQNLQTRMMYYTMQQDLF